MRRIIFIGTAVVVLIAASVAVAATLNTYTGKGGDHVEGREQEPARCHQRRRDADGEERRFNARAGALTDIKTTIYGLVSNAKKFPTCDGNKISAHEVRQFCPKNALIATGPVNSLLGDNDPHRGGHALQPRSSTCGTVAGASCGSSSPPGGKYQCAGAAHR